MKRDAQLQPVRRVKVSADGVVVVKSGPADQATEDAIDAWLLSLLDSQTTPGNRRR